MTPDEVSELVKIPPGTLRQWRHRGDRGPRSFRLGQAVRYRRQDVEAWLQAQLAKTGRGGPTGATPAA